MRLRRYRLVPALLALSLVLTATAPLTRASCGMTPEEMNEQPCHPAEMPATHAGMQHAPEAPRPDSAPAAPSDEAPCCSDEAPSLQSACCTAAEISAAPVLERLSVPPALLVLAAVLDAPAPEPPPSPPLIGEVSPAAPVALHVLYGRFLT